MFQNNIPMVRPTMGWPEVSGVSSVGSVPQSSIGSGQGSIPTVATPPVPLGSNEPDPSTSGIKSSGSPISSDNGKDGKER